ncbi:VasL domain-containing protein [Trabulsiella odontotermitis]|uniref:Membrane protein n=1 Tax=Trabulsiella odontotermitis TaxID=379893 RepID=A0A0L0GRC9_9ENTR|nr:type VI secretion system ImpA and VasL domain-containing protein [Trabulsiella odontotermitis]KNC91326.1 membrane protein [Trabulsiella odontotermitis]
MNISANTQTIITGRDPRGLPEFSAIREEVNKASHPAQPEMNWKLVESLALSIFKANGVDLHTAAYFTLARTRTQGLTGFCEGVELLAAMISHEWEAFWPQSGAARTEMLDWFNTRTGNILRQQMSFSEADLPLLYRVERALQVICDKLQQVELKRVPRVENLLYFVQNTRKRYEPQPKAKVADSAEITTVRTLIYKPENAETDVVAPLPELPEMRVTVHRSVTEMSAKRSVGILKGFVIGVACSAAVSVMLWWWLVYPLQQQSSRVRDVASGAAAIWLASPSLSDYDAQLRKLLSASPMQQLDTGEQMMRIAGSQWPESQQQQHATVTWNNMLNLRAKESPSLQGWQQTRTDLRAFAELLLQREKNKEGLTISYIKTVIYQAERMLNQEIPLEYLLTQYEERRAHGENTDLLEKQIKERLNGVLSRWWLLTKKPTAAAE